MMFIFPIQGFSQSGFDSKDDVEALYDRIDKEGEQRKQKIKKRKKIIRRKSRRKGKLAVLSDLEPFSDIAVVQRRFLPTSGRYELSSLLAVGMNNPFFNNVGLAFKGSYFFNTHYAVEVDYFALSPTKKSISKGLEDQTINTFGAFSNTYYGGSFKWTPFYGKTALLNKTIFHYDTYFIIGAGITNTDFEDAFTLTFGAGQTYAFNKSMALKVDLSMHNYTAKANQAGTITASQNDIFLSIGASFYFPEATYR